MFSLYWKSPVTLNEHSQEQKATADTDMQSKGVLVLTYV